MRKLLCAAFAAGSSLGLLLAADAFTGSWKMDVARSTFASDNPGPRELTVTFTEQGTNRTQVLKGIAADGSASSTAWTAPVTGGTAIFPPGQGPNGGATVKVIDDKTLVMTQNSGYGEAGASRIYRVSPDGKTLTLTQKLEDGQERAKLTFSRQQP
jgi:hypothetical protein